MLLVLPYDFNVVQDEATGLWRYCQSMLSTFSRRMYIRRTVMTFLCVLKITRSRVLDTWSVSTIRVWTNSLNESFERLSPYNYVRLPTANVCNTTITGVTAGRRNSVLCLLDRPMAVSIRC